MQRLLNRFLEYVRIDTTANLQSDDYPSSPGQWELGRLLVKQLLDLGLADARQDERGLIHAMLPATDPTATEVVVLNAHLDTSPETTGTNVRPRVVRDYAGGDIPLPGDPAQVIRVADNPELADLTGATLITTDGTTLLGADDKAGIAIIMETVALLRENPVRKHGPVRILFTCDEEIGRGIDHVDVPALNATVAYTLDGPAAGEIDVETFSADMATVKVRGVNIHPAIAKDRMVNAVRAAAAVIERLPRTDRSPETSAGRDGFLHPFTVEGGVAETTVQVLLRDFDASRLAEYAQLLRDIAGQVEGEFPGAKIDVEILRQYRNLGDGLAREPRAVTLAEEAYRRLGRSYRLSTIRGGTDGSLLTEKGLPTPNLSSGQHNPHSPLEWACLDEMSQAVEHLVQLLELWAE